MNNENFNDPLETFDPVMENAFSVNEENDLVPPEIETPSSNLSSPDVTHQETSHSEPAQPEPAQEENFFDAEEPIAHTTEKESNNFFDNDESFDIDESLFEESQAPNQGISVAKVDFAAPQNVNESQSYDKNLFKNIKVDVSIELGRSKVSLKKLYELKSGSIIELSRLVGEPLDLVIKDQVIARGEVVAVNSNYGIRITHIESLANLT